MDGRTDGWTDGWREAIALPSMLTRSVMSDVNAPLDDDHGRSYEVMNKTMNGVNTSSNSGYETLMILEVIRSNNLAEDMQLKNQQEIITVIN